MFPCVGEQLIGVISEPAGVGCTRAVVIIVGGPQYRAGSHRQFVQLSRALASQGFPCLRFDVRGMGDSTGGMRDFEHIQDDIRAAVDEVFRQCPSVTEVVLWGLCDGASAALMYAPLDVRLTGLVIVNPWMRSEATLARTRVKQYYLQRLTQPEFWRKIAFGEFRIGESARALVDNLRRGLLARPAKKGHGPLRYQDVMRNGLREFSGSVLLITSEHDVTAQEFLDVVRNDADWKAVMARKRIEHRVVDAADHTFSRCEWSAQAENDTAAWLRSW